jgi:hypothetical protein
MESYVREGENDDDTVMEASDYDHELELKTRSGSFMCMPKKYEGFEMTIAGI